MITYRITVDAKEEIVVKSGKFIIPVLEMLLWRQQAIETNDHSHLRANL